MGSEVPPLHIFFFPFMAHGHMIPTLDMAKLFASRGAKSTILTTRLNVRVFEKPIEISKNKNPGLDIGIEILDFPCVELGLPEGCENMDFVISNPDPEGGNLLHKFFFSTKFLKEQLEQLIQKIRPDCLMADLFFPWANESAEKFGVPTVVFGGTCVFSLCASDCVRNYEPHKKVASVSEPFVIPKLPGDIVITAEQMADSGRGNEETDMGRFMKEARESEKRSFGILVNSFYELEPAYADFYRNVLERRSWHIGPLSLCNRGIEEKAERGKKADIDEHECLKWLDSKKPSSVIYLSFGSMTDFTDAQLMEIAVGLERSGQDFIWVVAKDGKKGENGDWLPEGFEERTKGKGLIIRGWAPQVLILDHQATGGFVTHCGWNSVLEGISAGVPMVTWPIAAEQFYNEKLVTQMLKTGVSVGVRKWVRLVGDFMSRDKVEKAVREVMVGEEAEERRRRAKELAEMAKATVGEGGSSYNDLNRFMEELKLIRAKREKEQGMGSI